MILEGDPVDVFEEFNAAMGASGDASPYPGYAEALAVAPVHREDDGLFSAYSFEAVQRVLGDEEFSSAGYSEVMGVVFGRSILEMDEPEHHAYRSLIQQAFTRREMDRWETQLVGPLVDRLIDAFVADGAADLVRELLFPFPLMVIAELMGLPREDFPRFHRLAVELIGVTVDWDRALAASATLAEYFLPIIEARRDSQGDDLISVLARADHGGQQLTDDEILAFLRLLLPAGAETTYRSSSNLMLGLLTHPDQLEAIRDDRTLLPHAIEEGLRWEPPLLLVARLALVDTEVCGVAVPAGSMVLAHLGAANRDPSRWSDPDRFDIGRDRVGHLAFAHGPHKCLGLHLARMETRVVVNRLLDRLPGLRLDPVAPPPYISGMTFRAPPRLEVVWDAGQSDRQPSR